MKKLKTILFSMAGLTALAIPAISASCGQQKEQVKVSQISPDASLNSNVIKTAMASKNITQLPAIAVVTDSGLIDDKSFNQSSNEGALAFKDQIDKILPDGVKPVDVSYSRPGEGEYTKTYDALLSSGAKVWILSGFQHIAPLQEYIPSHLDQLKSKGIILIGIDFTLDPSTISSYPNFYGLSFNVQEPAYIVGQAVAASLKNSDNKTVTSFGGGTFPGVTNYMTGFLKGVLAYNKANSDSKVKVTTAVKGNDTLPLDSGFQPNDKMRQVINSLLQNTPGVILPVAGSATGVTLSDISSTGKKTSVIGVDVDQSLSFPLQKQYLLTSITKNIGQAVYDTILYSVLGIDSKHIFSSKQADKPFNIDGTYNQNWVGYSPSTIGDDNLKTQMNNLLKQYSDQFKSGGDNLVSYVDGLKVEDTDSAPQKDTASLVQALVQKINSLS